jgi:hypothetical protein
MKKRRIIKRGEKMNKKDESTPQAHLPTTITTKCQAPLIPITL